MKKRGRPLLYQTEEERKAAIRRTNATFLEKQGGIVRSVRENIH